ncbi:hypothetical protein [Pseudorhodoplanes sp.]|nr:hypothetical protein [Pseudorhodoplanes sp.]HWV55470.1 hypothetical protein [Pseudorhodoplanes sp.]
MISRAQVETSEQADASAREGRLRELAKKLMFKVTKSGEVFELVRRRT